MANYQSQYTGAEIDAGIGKANTAVQDSELTTAVTTALEQARESGDFKGDPGETGASGADGVSCTHAWSGTVLTVTSASGTSSADLKGETGAVGANGVSPTVSIAEITGGHTITITDANGSQSFDVMDGEDGADGSGGDGSGDMLKSIYDSDADGIVDNAAMLGGKLPSEYAGAIHTHDQYLTEESDPTVPGWAKADTKPTYTASEVGAAEASHAHDAFAVGVAGFVPAPTSDDSEKFLRGDGTWGEGGSSGIVYPTIAEEDLPTGVEELTGGTWIDGKPIYRYTWKGVSERSGSQGDYGQMPDGEPETVISLRGMFQRPSDGVWFTIPTVYYGGIKWAVNIRTNGSGGIKVGFGDEYTSDAKPMILICEYTKV